MSYLMKRIRDHVGGRVSSLEGDQSGAIAMMVLCACLIVFMMALVLFDAGFAARDKIDIQVAADTAAWSQSSVEARSMNMIAYVNVAKRVTYGMNAFYHALWGAWATLLALTGTAAGICWAANIPALGSLTALCKEITQFAVVQGKIMIQEAPDLGVLLGDLSKNYFGKDLEALDAYQDYMVRLTPWWGWSEGMLRGARNGALITAGFPVPRDFLSGLPSGGSITSQFTQGTGKVDVLPVSQDPRGDSDIIGEMCGLIYSEFDWAVHLADYALKNIDNASSNPWYSVAAYALTAGMAVGFLLVGCQTVVPAVQTDAWKPFRIHNMNSAADWQLATSTLTFAYQPNAKRMSDDSDGARKKYSYISEDYNHLLPVLYDAGGYWALSRSEFSYQNDFSNDLEAPDMWHASYTARMRPVALPGEWSSQGDDVTLVKAYRDTLPYIVGGGALLSALGGDSDGFGDLLSGGGPDLLRIELAVRGMTDNNIDGVAK